MALRFMEKKVLEKSLEDTEFFRKIVRPLLYLKARFDPERVHDITLEKIAEYEDVLKENSHKFNFPELYVNIAGHDVMPFGTAAGLDKNGDVMSSLSNIFGFLEVGTVIINPREGNPKPRIFADNKNQDLYNAQGFPSNGLEYFFQNLKKFVARNYNIKDKKYNNALLLVSICGIPETPENLDSSYEELEKIITSVNPHAHGFVWNPFSPNTAALTALRHPKEFRKAAELITKTCTDEIKLVKMGPYDDDEIKRKEWLDLVYAWLDGGGNGIVAVNTYSTLREKISSKKWGYPSAGRSGKFLQSYRDRAVRDAREHFPDSIIIATGGIDSAKEAWSAFLAGANALESYTPYTFNGFGLMLEMAQGIKKELYQRGYSNLKEFLAFHNEYHKIRNVFRI